MKRCYFRSQPQLNLSICNGQILIWTAQYTVHHHEILDCRPHTVRVQEVHSLHSNMEGVMAVSGCIFPVPFYCIESFQFCTLAFKYNMYHFRQYQPSDVLSVHSRWSSLYPITINFYLVDVRDPEDETRTDGLVRVLSAKVLLQEHVLHHEEKTKSSKKKKWKYL